jgi:hypothetical protein
LQQSQRSPAGSASHHLRGRVDVPAPETNGLWDQIAGFRDDWNQCRDHEFRKTDLGDGRILIPCFDCIWRLWK